MRDAKLIYTADLGFDLVLDSTGYPEQMDYEAQTGDQRAALAVAIEAGTIPCAGNIGIDWSGLYDAASGNSLADIKQQCEEMIEKCTTTFTGSGYIPLFEPKEDGGITVRTIRSGKE